MGSKVSGWGVESADLGGRVGWLPKAERVKTLFLSPLRPKQPFQPTPTPSPGSHQEVCRKNRNLRGLGGFCGEKDQAPGGPGPKPWGPGPQAPWRPGGAVQFHERRGSRLRSSISAAGPGPKPLGTWPTSQPCIPVKNSKNAPVLIGS